MLANVTLYWLTGSIGSSFWPYWARAHGDWSVQDVLARGGRLGPAAGYALSPADNIRAPREVAERFLDLIHEFREEAQLLVVSHQKRTMEAADCLYGVTMQPGGSSRVLSERVAAGS